MRLDADLDRPRLTQRVLRVLHEVEEHLLQRVSGNLGHYRFGGTHDDVDLPLTESDTNDGSDLLGDRRCVTVSFQAARAVQVEHLLGEFVHAQEFVDGQIGQFARLVVPVDPTAQDFETVPDAGDRIPHFVCELREQPGRGGQAIPLDELGLEHTQALLSVLELAVGHREFFDALGERIPHHLERLSDLIDLHDGGVFDWSREVAPADVAGGSGQRADRACEPGCEPHAYDEGDQEGEPEDTGPHRPKRRHDRELLGHGPHEGDARSTGEVRAHDQVALPGQRELANVVGDGLLGEEAEESHRGFGTARVRRERLVRSHEKDVRTGEHGQLRGFERVDGDPDARGTDPRASERDRSDGDDPQPLLGLHREHRRHTGPGRIEYVLRNRRADPASPVRPRDDGGFPGKRRRDVSGDAHRGLGVRTCHGRCECAVERHLAGVHHPTPGLVLPPIPKNEWRRAQIVSDALLERPRELAIEEKSGRHQPHEQHEQNQAHECALQRDLHRSSERGGCRSFHSAENRPPSGIPLLARTSRLRLRATGCSGGENEGSKRFVGGRRTFRHRFMKHSGPGRRNGHSPRKAR